MLRVVILLGGDGHHHIFPCHLCSGVNGLIHFRDVLQHFQQSHHIEAVLRKWLVANIFVIGRQLAVATGSQFI